MPEFTISETSIQRDIHNAVVTLRCQQTGTETIQDVRVFVSDILMAESGIADDDAAIIRAAQQWAEPRLRNVDDITEVSELRMHTGNTDA